MIPQLRGRDLDSIIRWVEEFIARDKLQGTFSQTSEPEVLGAIGQTQIWFSVIIPQGWVEIDNSLLFITEAPELYNLIGLQFDPTPPAGMFRLPQAPPLPNGKWIIRAK